MHDGVPDTVLVRDPLIVCALLVELIGMNVRDCFIVSCHCHCIVFVMYPSYLILFIPTIHCRPSQDSLLLLMYLVIFFVLHCLLF